jgi:hypothetical protein
VSIACSEINTTAFTEIVNIYFVLTEKISLLFFYHEERIVTNCQNANLFSIRERIASFRCGITPKELSSILDVDESTISRRVKAGMPCERFGGSVRFSPKELLKWMDQQ